MNSAKKTLLLAVAVLAASASQAQKAPRLEITPYINNVNADAAVRKTASNIIIAGSGLTLRAFEPYGGDRNEGGYADAVNKYQEVLGKKVQVYCMTIPTAVAFYCPDGAAEWTRNECAAINNIYGKLSADVKSVNAYTTLGSHAHEPIYSRTDHHWAPLGAFYAAREFARVAGVPFASLDAYEKRVVRNYVGSMARFSRDAAVKHSPETFVYYVPRDSSYTTTMTVYTLDKGRKRVVSQSEPQTANFFRTYKDGSGAAYCTFMGGDDRTVAVRTNTANHRRLLILKDSYGNALPPYLFGSFEEVHVADCRYFTPNVVDYVRRNGITDVLFANNLIHASMPKTVQSYMKDLEQ